MSKPVVQVHVRPVEEGVALAKNGDISAAVQMKGYLFCHFVVKIRHCAFVAAGMFGQLGGYGIDHRQLNLLTPQLRLDYGASVALTMAGRWISNHMRLLDDSKSLQRYQLRIARTETHAKQSSSLRGFDHSSLLASALTAAAAMALPPRRP